MKSGLGKQYQLADVPQMTLQGFRMFERQSQRSFNGVAELPVDVKDAVLQRIHSYLNSEDETGFPTLTALSNERFLDVLFPFSESFSPMLCHSYFSLFYKYHMECEVMYPPVVGQTFIDNFLNQLSKEEELKDTYAIVFASRCMCNFEKALPKVAFKSNCETYAVGALALPNSPIGGSPLEWLFQSQRGRLRAEIAAVTMRKLELMNEPGYLLLRGNLMEMISLAAIVVGLELGGDPISRTVAEAVGTAVGWEEANQKPLEKSTASNMPAHQFCVALAFWAVSICAKRHTKTYACHTFWRLGLSTCSPGVVFAEMHRRLMLPGSCVIEDHLRTPAFGVVCWGCMQTKGRMDICGECLSARVCSTCVRVEPELQQHHKASCASMQVPLTWL
jgi:hypothetical protein